MKPVIKTLLGGAAAAIVAGIAFAPPAQAACQWTGSAWNCDGQMVAAPYYIPAPSWGFDARDYQVNSPAPQTGGQK